MMPGRSRNCRRTSSTIEEAARPTAVMPMAPKRYGKRPAKQQAATEEGLAKQKFQRHAVEVRVRRGVADEEVETLVIGGEQPHRAEAGRPDGIALGPRLGGVTDRVQRIGRLAH